MVTIVSVTVVIVITVSFSVTVTVAGVGAGVVTDVTPKLLGFVKKGAPFGSSPLLPPISPRPGKSIISVSIGMTWRPESVGVVCTIVAVLVDGRGVSSGEDVGTFGLDGVTVTVSVTILGGNGELEDRVAVLNVVGT